MANQQVADDVHSLQEQIGDLSAQLNDRRREQANIEQMLQDKNLVIAQMEGEVDEKEKLVAQIHQRVALAEAQSNLPSTTIHNGILLWKIEGYLRKRQDAMNGVNTPLYSPPFYSSQHGYKMCAVIYLNGNGFGRESHLSLFFAVMRGEWI
jgi:hypothetical protein